MSESTNSEYKKIDEAALEFLRKMPEEYIKSKGPEFQELLKLFEDEEEEKRRQVMEIMAIQLGNGLTVKESLKGCGLTWDEVYDYIMGPTQDWETREGELIRKALN